MSLIRAIALLAALTLTLAPSARAQTILRVKANAASGGNGRSWAAALNNLHDALAIANPLGSAGQAVEIWVAQGTYRGDVARGGFSAEPHVSLYGGFAGNEQTLEQRVLPVPRFHTVLSGDLDDDDIIVPVSQLGAGGFGATWAENVRTLRLNGDGPNTVDGFTIRNGYANEGAGIKVYSQNVTIAHCFFYSNWAIGDAGAVKGGGALADHFNSDVVVYNCEFINNLCSAGFGGAVNVYSARGIPNTDSITDFTFVNCLFAANRALQAGGVNLYSAPNQFGGGQIVGRFINCTFADNASDQNFGSAVTTSAGGFPNWDPGECSTSIANCVVANNSPGNSQIVNGVGVVSTIVQYTWYNGQADLGTTFIDGNVNGVVWEDVVTDLRGPDGIPGTLDEDFRLPDASSAAIDAGDDSAYLGVLPSIAVDLDGSTRFIDADNDPQGLPTIDMGCYEFRAGCPTCPGGRTWLSPTDGAFDDVPNWDIGPPGPNNVARFDKTPADPQIPYHVDFEGKDQSSDRLLITGPTNVVFDLNGANYDILGSSPDGAIVVGDVSSDNATLTVSNNSAGVGGQVTGLIARIGKDAGSIGTVNVQDGAELFLFNRLFIGSLGSGSLDIGPSDPATGSGARVTTFDAVVGDLPGAHGTLHVREDSVFDAPFGLTVRRGDVIIDSTATLSSEFVGVFVFKDGSLTGEGLIDGDLVSIGSIALTSSTSTLTVTDEYKQARPLSAFGPDSGSLVIPIGGATGSPTAGHLEVLGDATLGGGIFVRFEAGFVPDPIAIANANLELLTAGAFLDGDDPDTLPDTFGVGLFPGLPNTNQFLTFSIAPGAARDDGSRAASSVLLQVSTLAGDVGFDPPDTATAPAGSPAAATLADMDGVLDPDGNLTQDLVIALPDPANPTTALGSVVVLYNAGTTAGAWGGFSGSKVFAAGVNPSAVAVANLGGDALPDIVVTNRGTPGNPAPDSITVHIDPPPGVSLPPQTETIPVGDEPRDVALVDLDLDGFIDIGVVNAGSSDTLMVLWNAGSSARGAGSRAIWLGVDMEMEELDLPDDPVSIRPGDFDAGTFLPFFAIGCNGDGSVSLVDNDGVRGLSVLATLPVDTGPVQLLVANLNGDSLPEIMTVNTLSNTISVLVNTSTTGAVSFQPSVDLPVAGTQVDPRSMAAGDFDADGDADLAVVADNDAGTARIVRILRNDLFASQLAFALADDQDPGTDPLIVLAGDLNADGKDDVVTVSESGSKAAAAEAGTWPAGESRRRGNTGARSRPGEGRALGDVAVLLARVCPGDVNGDGATTVFDFGILAGNYGASGLPSNTGGDLDNDGDVDVFDFAIFAGDFGCPN